MILLYLAAALLIIFSVASKAVWDVGVRERERKYTGHTGTVRKMKNQHS
jgi:hypothetical protein